MERVLQVLVRRQEVWNGGPQMQMLLAKGHVGLMISLLSL